MAAYEFIGPDHSFYPQIELLRAALAAEPRSLKPKLSGRSLLRIDFQNERPALKWAYVSEQSPDAAAFYAKTFLVRSKRNRVERYEFPEDPKLDGLQSVLDELGADWKVLRYIPRRRLTVKSGESIAKIVRPAELLDVVRRLKRVEATLGKGSGFHAPRLITFRPESGLFFQEILHGQGIESLLNRTNFSSLLEMAGRISCRIHRHAATDFLRLDPSSMIETARRDEALLTVLRPELKAWLARVLKALFSGLASIHIERTFCHGDFRAPHLLATISGDWGVVDFDGAACADRHWEQALFVTSLKRDCPLFLDQDLHETAIGAFLRGYEREGGKVNASTLQWFRLAAEIHFLARSFQRDLYTPELFEQTVHTIGALSETGSP